MATSAVPAAIDALVSIATAAYAESKILIIDGPPTVDMSAPDVLTIGWQPDTSDQAAASVQTFASAGARRRDEELSIDCWLSCWTGDSDAAARRQRAYELLAVLENALRATDTSPTAPTLNGTVLWSQLSSVVLKQIWTDQGVSVGLAFSINCHARI